MKQSLRAMIAVVIPIIYYGNSAISALKIFIIRKLFVYCTPKY